MAEKKKTKKPAIEEVELEMFGGDDSDGTEYGQLDHDPDDAEVEEDGGDR